MIEVIINIDVEKKNKWFSKWISTKRKKLSFQEIEKIWKIRLEKHVNSQNFVKLNMNFKNKHYPRTNFMYKNDKYVYEKNVIKDI